MKWMTDFVLAGMFGVIYSGPGLESFLSGAGDTGIYWYLSLAREIVAGRCASLRGHPGGHVAANGCDRSRGHVPHGRAALRRAGRPRSPPALGRRRRDGARKRGASAATAHWAGGGAGDCSTPPGRLQIGTWNPSDHGAPKDHKSVSDLLARKLRPAVHQVTALLEQVRPGVGPLHGASHLMRQSRLGDRMRNIRLLARPVSE